MITTGNPDQWEPSYPGRELLVKNITDGQAYVLEEKGKVHGAFCIYCRRRTYVYEDL